MKKTMTPVQVKANLELARAMQELRRSSATAPKPQRTLRKQRSRSGAKRAAIAGW